ncbi:MAG TPA: FMN-binding protein [Humibacter sp.]|nr:FMN-binding protein [Humibacter sp.]
MKKIIYGLLATVTGVVLLFSYRTSLDAVAPAASTGSTTGDGSESTPSGSTSTPSSSPSASTSSNSLKDGSYTGQAVDTRYGPVQVQVTVSGGKITRVSVPQYPTESFRDQQINQQAVPTLVSETLSAQSAKIDMVSGATYTSDGYLQSLQSALDGARA